jgi:hypothetical protein
MDKSLICRKLLKDDMENMSENIVSHPERSAVNYPSTLDRITRELIAGLIAAGVDQVTAFNFVMGV